MMKKRLLIILFLFIYITIPKAKAEDNYNLYCEYTKNGSPAYAMLVDFTLTDEDTFDYEFTNLATGEAAYSEIAPVNRAKLREYGMLSVNLDKIQCPSLSEKKTDSGVSLVLWSNNHEPGATYENLTISTETCPSYGCYVSKQTSEEASQRPPEESTSFYCEYTDELGIAYSLHIEMTSANADSFDYTFTNLRTGGEAYSILNPDTKEMFIKYGMVNINTGLMQCPYLREKTSSSGVQLEWANDPEDGSSSYKYLAIHDQICPSTGCYMTNLPTIIEKPAFECNYQVKSKNEQKKIVVKREVQGGDVIVTHPDGSTTVSTNGLLEMNEAGVCPDFYYNTKTKAIKVAVYNYLGNLNNAQTYDPSLYSFVCGEANEDIEYYCSGTCQYLLNHQINCGEITSTIERVDTNLGEMCQIEKVRSVLKFFGYLFLIVKILIPIIIIVFGVIDFAKAVAASDADAIQKSTKSFVFRILAGIIIFFLPTVINFTFKILLQNNTSRFNDCRVCVFEPNNCP